MSVIKKYLKLLVSLFKTSFIADLEYRINFVTQIVTDILWYGTQISIYEVLFSNTKIIGDWDITQTRVFLAIVFVVDCYYMLFFHANLDNFTEKIRKGDLDLLLSKPINSQFMVSFQKIDTAYISNLIITHVWFLYTLSLLPEFHIEKVLLVFLYIPFGIVITYSLRFLISSTAVIFTKSESLQFIWYSLYRIAMRPDAIYPQVIRMIILTVFPMAFIASIPARVLFEPFSMSYLLLGLVVSMSFIYITHRFWNFSLKYYSSASS